MIHFAAEFLPEQVRVRRVDTTVQILAEVQAIIDAAWEEGRRRLGDRLYDGPMARLDSWRIEGGVLHLEFSRTGYKHFYGTNLTHPELGFLANPLGISALLETADGHLLMGIRGGGVAFHNNRVHPLGGTVEWGQLDCFAEIRREIEEEAGLGAADLSELVCVGLAEDPAIRQPELMFWTKTGRSLSAINLDRHEHGAMWSIPRESAAVEKAIADPALTPIAVDALRLWYDARQE